MTRRLRVGVVCAYYLPRNNAPTVRLRYFVECLAKRHDVHVLTADAGGPMDGIRISRWPAFAQQNRKSAMHRMVTDALFGVRVVLHLVRARYDVLVVSSPVFLASSMVTRFAALRGMRVVLDVRDIYPEVFASAGKLRADSLLYRWFLRMATRMYRASSAIVTVTEGLRQRITARAGDGAPIHLVRNGFSTSLLSIREAKHERFSAVFHGTLGAFQDVDGLVALAQRLQPHGIDLIVIGKGSREDRLRTGAPASLKFMGELSFEDTLREVSRAHVGVSLRTDDAISREAFPVKLFEYMGLGLPMVSTPKSEAGALLAHTGMGEQFDSSEIDAVTGAIVRWRDDPDAYAEAIAAIESGRLELTRERQAEVFNRIVESVTREGSAA